MSETLIADAGTTGTETATGTGLPAPAAEQQQSSETSKGPGQGAGNDGAADGGQSTVAGTATENAAGDAGGETTAGNAGDDALGAPETYAAFSLPDGVTLGDELTTDISALAKELNLPQAKAQKIAELGAKHVSALQAAQAEAVSTAQAEWKASATTDKEFGGDKLATSTAIARKALETFGTPELKELLIGSKLGDHPEVVRLLFRVGSALGEDKIVTGAGGDKTQSKSQAERMFPKMKTA